MTYTKLDSGITESTIWQAPDTTRLVWITLLSMVDQNGYVGASMPGLAGRARVSLEACIAAIDAFMAPDKWSRTKDHEGRRIAEAEGGWILLNHAKYRAAQNAEDRRERSRIAMAELRNKRKLEATVNKRERKLSKLPHTDADASTATTSKGVSKASPSQGVAKKAPPVSDEGRFTEFWEAWPTTDRKQDRKKCLAKWRGAKLDLIADRILAHVVAMKATQKWRDGFDPLVLTYLNGERWDDPVPPDRRPGAATSDPDARRRETTEGARKLLFGDKEIFDA